MTTQTPLLADLDLPLLDPWGNTSSDDATADGRRAQARGEREVRSRSETRDPEDLDSPPPAKGECLHTLSNGRFDYFGFVGLILTWIGADSLYGSTWTMSRGNAMDLLKFYDDGKIGQITLASGNYFLKRESAVAATVLQGLRDRGQRFTTWENHAKVILLNNAAADQWFVAEGIANWTANPRTEQNILLNDRATWEFHRDWLEEMFSQGEKRNG